MGSGHLHWVQNSALSQLGGEHVICPLLHPKMENAPSSGVGVSLGAVCSHQEGGGTGGCPGPAFSCPAVLCSAWGCGGLACSFPGRGLQGFQEAEVMQVQPLGAWGLACSSGRGLQGSRRER